MDPEKERRRNSSGGYKRSSKNEKNKGVAWKTGLASW